MEHPFYSPDLAPSNFWLFLKTKSALKRQRFQGTEDKNKYEYRTAVSKTFPIVAALLS